MSELDLMCPECREFAKERIAALEAELEKAGDDLGGYWVDRANEAEAELAVSKRLNGKWMDERTEAIIRAESAEAHVVELERYLKAGREEWLLTRKALEQAEAHAADCKRLVTACENDIDAEHMKRLEAEAEVEKWQWIATNACEELAYETHVNPRSPLDIRLARWERGDTT